MHFGVKNTFKKQPQPHFQTQLAKHFIHAFLLTTTNYIFLKLHS